MSWEEEKLGLAECVGKAPQVEETPDMREMGGLAGYPGNREDIRLNRLRDIKKKRKIPDLIPQRAIGHVLRAQIMGSNKSQRPGTVQWLPGFLHKVSLPGSAGTQTPGFEGCLTYTLPILKLLPCDSTKASACASTSSVTGLTT